MAKKVISHAFVTDGTVTADGNSGTFTIANVTKASLYAKATLGGTTPSYNVFLQTKDANGNWHDVGSGAGAITSSGETTELGITGPFGSVFRVRHDVDVASADETYTGVDVAVDFEVEYYG